MIERCRDTPAHERCRTLLQKAPSGGFSTGETNAGERDAHIAITLLFKDRDPVGPYRVTVPARRTLHLRFNDLTEPEPVPRDTDYASLFESDVPIVVQHTRLDSRKAELALLSTMAFPVDG